MELLSVDHFQTSEYGGGFLQELDYYMSKDTYFTYYSPTLAEKAIIFWCLVMVNWQEFHNLSTHNYKIETLADLIKNEDVKASFLRHRQK